MAKRGREAEPLPASAATCRRNACESISRPSFHLPEGMITKAGLVSDPARPFSLTVTPGREGSTDDGDRTHHKGISLAPGNRSTLIDGGQGTQVVRAPDLAIGRQVLPELRQPRHARGESSEDAVSLPGLPQVFQGQDRHHHGRIAVAATQMGIRDLHGFHERDPSPGRGPEPTNRTLRGLPT